MGDYNNIHYSCSGGDTEESHWALCVKERDEDITYIVTKDVTRVQCKDCQNIMPQVFSVLYKDPEENEVTVIVNILAQDRKQAIEIAMHFVDTGELRTLEGNGVNFKDLFLVRSTTSTFMN